MIEMCLWTALLLLHLQSLSGFPTSSRFRVSVKTHRGKWIPFNAGIQAANTNRESRISLEVFFATDVASTVASSAARSDPSTAAVVANTFVASVTTRLIGILIGNILAGAFVRYVSHLFRNVEEEEKDDGEKVKNRNDTQTFGINEQEYIGSQSISPTAFLKLVICIAIDLLGDGSFLLPGVGELEDIAWAPVSAYTLQVIFGSNIITGLDFVKELLPGIDFIPVATLAWFLTYVAPPNPLSNALGIKQLKSDGRTSTVAHTTITREQTPSDVTGNLRNGGKTG